MYAHYLDLRCCLATTITLLVSHQLPTYICGQISGLSHYFYKSYKVVQLMERLDRLESDCATPPPRRGVQQRQTAANSRRENRTPRKPVVCHKCGKEGRFAKGCAVRHSQPPGN